MGFLLGTDPWDGVDHSLHFVLIEGENQFFSGAHGQIMGNRTASGPDRSATTRENFERVEWRTGLAGGGSATKLADQGDRPRF